MSIQTSAELVILVWLGLPGVAVCQCRYGARSQNASPDLKLVVSTKEAVARISQPVVVHVELSNQSSAPVSMSDTWMPARDYELHLYDSKGKEVPLTEIARRLRFTPIHSSQNTLVLAPREKLQSDQNLADVYTVSTPGNYTLEACREILGIGNIYSNKLVLPFTR